MSKAGKPTGLPVRDTCPARPSLRIVNRCRRPLWLRLRARGWGAQIAVLQGEELGPECLVVRAALGWAAYDGVNRGDVLPAPAPRAILTSLNAGEYTTVTASDSFGAKVDFTSSIRLVTRL